MTDLSDSNRFTAIPSYADELPIWLPTGLIIVTCIIYEWVGVFDLKLFQPAAIFFKVSVPLFLLLIVYPGKLHPRRLKRFIYFFAAFMSWGAFATIMFNPSMEGLLQWSKFLFRFLFCVGVCLYFMKRPSFHPMMVMKILVIIGVATVVQYFILEIISAFGWGQNYVDIEISQGGRYYGPQGILGNGTAQFSTFYRLPKFQLTGFWMEPSNAGAYLFMASFLASAIYIRESRRIWVAAGGLCCLGGFCTFSNGVYFAIGFATLIGHIINFMHTLYMPDRKKFLLMLRRAITYTLLIALSIFLIFFSLFGRFIAVNYLPDNIPLKALAGVRGVLLSAPATKPAPATEPAPIRKPAPAQKPAATLKGYVTSFEKTLVGRTELIKNIFIDRSFFKILVGDGLRIPGKDGEGRGTVVSATAPIMWLLFTGIIGLTTLFLRELQVFVFVKQSFPLSDFQLQIFQAWLVLFFQHMAYGTWMTPLYLVLIALIFSSFSENNNYTPVILSRTI